MAVLGGLASAWWVVPLLVHARFGVDFLQFTERPDAIWATNSAPEALRLMAYWTTYVGVGFAGPDQPLFSEAGTLLFNPLVVGASLLLPALAVAGFAVVRRHRYAPFLLLLLVVGALIELAGFPDGTPARVGMQWVYDHFPLLRFLRTTQKAAPLVALGTAGLLGLGARMALRRLRELRHGTLRRAALVAAPAGLVLLIALAALPLVRGTAVEKTLTWDEIPRPWAQAGADLDRTLPPNSRALVLPGQVFAYYRWGGTVDSIVPRVTERPVGVRYETPYSDPRATDLLWTTDRLVAQRRLAPRQLKPLLRLAGTGAVVTGTDDDLRRSGAIPPAVAAAELSAQGLSTPSRSYGKGPAGLPQVRRYDLDPGRGLVSVAPRTGPVIVDGAAEGLANMAAFGTLPERRPIIYAGDLSASELAAQAQRGADVVVTDSNRRRRFVAEFARANLGETLQAEDELDRRFAAIEPFAERGPDAQTVSQLEGARYVRAPNQGGLLEFPERNAIAGFDGDRETVWAADRYLRPAKRWIEIGFDRPRDVPYVDLEPIRDPYGVEAEVDVSGVKARLGPGVTRVRTGLKNVSSLRITLTKVIQPRGNLRGSGGFREIRIPGVSVRRSLRPPVLVGRALAGRDLSRVNLSYLLERTTADEPLRRDRYTGSPLLERFRDRADPERLLDRVLVTPAARGYSAEAWVYPAVDARDSELDRLAGLRGPAVFDSSARFNNQPRNRASSAFDDDGRTAWVGIWAPGSAPLPYLEWRAGRTLRLSGLRVTASRAGRRPTRVRVSADGRASPPLRVGADGSVRLPRALRGRTFRLTVLEASRTPGAPGHAVALASVDAAGLPAAEVPRTGSLRTRCGDVRIEVAGRLVPLRPVGSLGGLEAGRPLRARGCSRPARMGAGEQRVRALPGPFSVDRLRLASAASSPAAPVAEGGRVLAPGRQGNSKIDGVRVALDGPSWLVLGQSFSRGWRATCDGRSLGAPKPINGYANGWRAPASCRDVSFSFAAQSWMRVGYLISALTCLALLAFLVVGRFAGITTTSTAVDERPASEPGAALAVSLPRAAAVALLVSLPLALLFALRTGVVIFPLLTLVFWRGVGAQALSLGAAALLGVAAPIAYAISSPRDRGGYNFEYGLETIWAHWIGVTALVLLVVACWRSLADR